MKKIHLFSAVILMFFGIIAIGQETSLKPYGLKSGIIEYSYSGSKVGKGILYFDDYGMKSAMYTDALEGGEQRKGWVVSFGEYQYMWDPEVSKDGMKLKNPFIEWAAKSSGADLESFTESLYKKMGMSRSGTETMLGKECTLYKGKRGKLLIWNGILILLDMKMLGITTHQEAISIQTNIPVEGKYFVIPKDIRFVEMQGFR